MRNFVPPICVAVAVVTVAVALAACGSSGSSSSNAGASKTSASTKASTSKSGSHIKVAYFELVQANTFVHAEYEGMSSVAKADGVDLVPFDGDLNASQQTSQIQDANASGGYGGYLVEAVSNSALYPVKQAISKGIKVATVNQPLGPNQATGATQIPGEVASVMTPATTDGDHVGQLIVKACGTAPCKVGVIVAATSNPSESGKLTAIRQVISSHHNISIVGVGQGQFTTSGGITAAQNLMQANPDINVLASTGDDMELGAQKVIDQLGKADVKLIGGGGSSTAVSLVRSGKWFGTTTKLPYSEGQLAMKALVASIRGDKKTGLSIDPDSSSVGRKIGPLIDKQSVTKDAAFAGQWQA
jgi:ribose transport system substrate-binding protein